MAIINPKMFSEGDVTDITDLTKFDDEWDSVSETLDSYNIRAEGLDRRVIKTKSWCFPQSKPGPSYFYSSNDSATSGLGYHDDYTVMRWPSGHASGGTDGQRARIQSKWRTGQSGGIRVRCSFRVYWPAAQVMTHTSDYPDKNNAAGNGLQFELVRYPVDGSVVEQAVDGCVIRLCKQFGHNIAKGLSNSPILGEEPPSDDHGDITTTLDTRSNVNCAVTLIDCFLPEDAPSGWEDVGGSSTTWQDIRWELRGRWTLLTGDMPDPDKNPDVVIEDINFYAQEFVR